MAKAATRRDVLWGYIAQALNIGAGLILLPAILHYLSSEDVGLWFVFITLAGLAQLLEFGFQPTLARNTAYIYAGAQSLPEQGLPPVTNPNEPINLQLLADLVEAVRAIYRIVAALAALVLLGGGTLYIWTLLTPRQDVASSLIAWLAFAIGYIATFYYGYFNGLLQGRGDITAANMVIAITRGSLVVLGSIAVMAGFGLMGLGVASLVSSVIGRWFARRFYFSTTRLEICASEGMKAQSSEMIKTLWHNASRLGAVQVGAFLIQRANILLASSFLGLVTAASFGMTVTVLMALSNIAMVICQVQLPHMNALQAAGERFRLRAVYGEVIIIAWIIFVFGLIALGLWGDTLLTAISSRTRLLSSDQLMVLGLILLLEANHSIAATYLTTTNEIPFLGAALWSGLAIFALGLALVPIWGIWGLIVAQGIVQLAYNNWKWPKATLAHLGGDITGIVRNGSKRIAEQLRG